MNGLSHADKLRVIAHMADWDGPERTRYELSWDCPTCDAVPGKKCRTVATPSSILSSAHQARRGLAWTELAAELAA